MLASLEYLALLHPESDIPGHTGLIPPKLQTPGHPSSSSMSLLMGVPDQLSAQAKWADYTRAFLVMCSGC